MTIPLKELVEKHCDGMGHSNWFFFGGSSVPLIPNDICAEVLCIHAIVASVYFFLQAWTTILSRMLKLT